MKKFKTLEGVRGCAALYVVVHHLQLLPNAGVGRALYFGQEAVIVFFLLSGFVISTSTIRRSPSVREYLFARAIRIFPIFSCALALSYVSYSLVAGEWVDPNLPNLAGNLMMQQDVSSLKRGVWVETYMGNSPLWSLSYEWWFYMLFIPIALLPSKQSRSDSNLWALGISVAGFVLYQLSPNQPSLFASYFIIWWSGVSFAHIYEKHGSVSWAAGIRTSAPLLVMSILWLVPVIIAYRSGQTLSLGVDPVLQLRHHFAAFALALICIACLNYGPLRKAAEVAVLPFAVLAPLSYAIYIVHRPIIDLVEKSGLSTSRTLSTLVVLVATITIAWLLEIKMQKAVTQYFRS